MHQSTSTTGAPWERTASPNSLRPTFTTATWWGSSTTEPVSWSVTIGVLVLWGVRKGRGPPGVENGRGPPGGENGRTRAHRALGGRLPDAHRGARAGDPGRRAPRIQRRQHRADANRAVPRVARLVLRDGGRARRAQAGHRPAGRGREGHGGLRGPPLRPDPGRGHLVAPPGATRAAAGACHQLLLHLEHAAAPTRDGVRDRLTPHSGQS